MGKNTIITKTCIWYLKEFYWNNQHIALSLILKFDEMYWKIHTFMICPPYIYLFLWLLVSFSSENTESENIKLFFWFFFSYSFLLFVTIAYFLCVDLIRTWCTIWLKYKAFQILLMTESYFFKSWKPKTVNMFQEWEETKEQKINRMVLCGLSFFALSQLA